MPAKSIEQQQLMGADLARKRAGEKTRTGMTGAQLEEFAGATHEGLPVRKKVGRGDWGSKEKCSAGGSKTVLSKKEMLG